ncbi:MAG: 30S ribosomal protein S4 [Parcubacteria group bacterium CG2_30_36_18]|nr:MAG: 30S ribosomal protein S4 [Parcubacteria group bacterium CG2_30_36_18]
MKKAKCKICRRLGAKLFLRGERCLSPKCPMLKKAYPPGQKRKRRPIPLSEYGKESREKQKLKSWYNLKERQFKNYVKKVLAMKGKVEDASEFLVNLLETRLDNVVFRLGLANSRAQAKQLVSHAFVLINGKSIDTPSYQVKKGDIISLKSQKMKKANFQNLKNMLKKYKTPGWLELNVEKLEGKVIGEPTLEESAPPVEIPAIFEFYSR